MEDIENVSRAELSAWTSAKRPGLPGGNAGDVRSLGIFQNEKSRRQLTLQKALELTMAES